MILLRYNFRAVHLVGASVLGVMKFEDTGSLFPSATAYIITVHMLATHEIGKSVRCCNREPSRSHTDRPKMSRTFRGIYSETEKILESIITTQRIFINMAFLSKYVSPNSLSETVQTSPISVHFCDH